MSDFFDYMVVWNTKKRADTFIKYFIRGYPNKKEVNDFNRAFLIVEPNILNNVVSFLAKYIRTDPLYKDVGYTFSITDKLSWKSVQMVVYIYQFSGEAVTCAYPFELQILTPQVLAFEHFQMGHALYELQRIEFDKNLLPVWTFLLDKGVIENPNIKELVQKKVDDQCLI